MHHSDRENGENGMHLCISSCAGTKATCCLILDSALACGAHHTRRGSHHEAPRRLFSEIGMCPLRAGRDRALTGGREMQDMGLYRVCCVVSAI
jgi:hypothetical protein